MAKNGATEEIRDFLEDLEGEAWFEVTFSYNGTAYRTVFNANKEPMAGMENVTVLGVDNGCIGVTATYHTDGDETTATHESHIHAENRKTMGHLRSSNGKSACFEPVLLTNARGTVRRTGKRTTSGDVLQILKTKLLLAFPDMEGEPLRLFDGAHDVATEGVGAGTFLTPFHLVRGGDAYYEKYGYHSPVITGLKPALRRLTWSGCTEPAKAIIRDCTKKDYADDQLLTTLMKEIPWEAEVAYNTTHPLSLSQTVLKEFALTLFPRGADLQTFELDTESDDWLRCDAELVLTGFEPVANPLRNAATGFSAKGGRRTRRLKRSKANRSKANRRRN